MQKSDCKSMAYTNESCITVFRNMRATKWTNLNYQLISSNSLSIFNRWGDPACLEGVLGITSSQQMSRSDQLAGVFDSYCVLRCSEHLNIVLVYIVFCAARGAIFGSVFSTAVSRWALLVRTLFKCQIEIVAYALQSSLTRNPGGCVLHVNFAPSLNRSFKEAAELNLCSHVFWW